MCRFYKNALKIKENVTYYWPTELKIMNNDLILKKATNILNILERL